MGIVRKAVIGSLIVGLGAVAVAKNRKAIVKVKKGAARMGTKIVQRTKSALRKAKNTAVGPAV